jgi:predicted O-methyltransferase YrrM
VLPPDFSVVSDQAWARVRDTPGYLAEREARFLMLAAAATPARGAIVEVGSFKGRSTVGLAIVAQHYELGRVVAVDPHTSPSGTDPDLGGLESSYDECRANLEAAGVADWVSSRRALSQDVARSWTGAIRLLWLDGDHEYESVRQDLALFRPHLAAGAVVVMHDTLGTYEGPLRVFVEDVLGCDDFGPAGFCKSIGWAQYRPGDGGARRFRRRRLALARRARHLIAIARAERAAPGSRKWRYKFWRALVPHGALDPRRWVRDVALPPTAPSR